MMRTPILLLTTACLVLAGCIQPAGTDGAEDPTVSPGPSSDDFSQETFQGTKGSLIASVHHPDGSASTESWTVFLGDGDDDDRVVKVRSGATQLVARAEWTPAAPTTEWRFCTYINGNPPDEDLCVTGSGSPLELTLPPEGTNLTTGTYVPLMWVAEHDTAPANAGAAVEVHWEATVTYGNPE